MELGAPVHYDGNTNVLRIADFVGDTGTWYGRGFYGQRCALACCAEHAQGLGLRHFRRDDSRVGMGGLPSRPCVSGRPGARGRV